MPDVLDLTGGDPNAATPEAVARWIQQAQSKLQTTGRLAPNEIPTGYKVENGQLVQDTQLWSSIYKGLLGTAGMATLGVLLGPTLGAGALAGEIEAAPLQASSVLTEGAAGAAAGGAAGGVAGAAAGGSDGVLPSTATVPNTGALVPATTSSMSAVVPGASAGLPDWLKNAHDLGSALSSTSMGRAQGRIAEGLQNQNQARAQVDLYNSELNAPAKIASNAVRGDILSNAHDVNIAAPSTIPVPKITGGLHPDMFSPETRATGVGLRSNALASAGNLTPVTPPVLPPLPEAGTLDSILNTGSSVANISGSVPWDKIPWGKIASAF